MHERKAKLLKEKKMLDEALFCLSESYKKKLAVLDKNGNLTSLKVSLHEQASKKQAYDKICFLSEQSEKQKDKLNRLLLERNEIIFQLIENKNDNATIVAFEKSILEIHDYLYGNKVASFKINIEIPKTC